VTSAAPGAAATPPATPPTAPLTAPLSPPLTAASRGWLLDPSAAAIAWRPQVLAILSPLLRAGLLHSCPVIDLRVLGLARSAAEHRAMAADRALVYAPVPLSAASAERARELQTALARAGHHGRADPDQLLIAGIALEHDLTLLHHDSLFPLLGELCGLDQVAIAPLPGHPFHPH
jgi:predicted nucleic acid-binding protein